jgi:hypothetical protein
MNLVAIAWEPRHERNIGTAIEERFLCIRAKVSYNEDTSRGALGNIRGLNLAVVKPTTVRVTKLPL